MPSIQQMTLECLDCGAVGAVLWEFGNIGREGWKHANLTGAFHIETGRAKKPLIICNDCDTIYGPFPDKPQP